MRKKVITGLFVFFTVSIFIVVGAFVREKIVLKNAKVTIEFVDNLEVAFLDKVKVSDFISYINGTIVDDYFINTEEIGKKKIDFIFVNEDNVKVPYSFDIYVKDIHPPVVWLNNVYTVIQGSNSNIKEKILCGDDADPTPVCEIIGDYDVDNIGTYPLAFKATDSSGNVTEKDFSLKVVAPSKGNSTVSSKKTLFSDVINEYKNENTEIGIDISHHQGDVNFVKLKEAGVEFVIIRVGTTKNNDSEYVLDSKFIQNITQANEIGMPVGIYFYSSSNSREKAILDAKWILEQIKPYKIDLPIAFDWEKWNIYNQYHLSFFGLTDMAHAYLDVFKEAGYEGMLYSSKSYLEKIWLETDYPIWLAHYTKKTNYEKDYAFWQICSNGLVDGIEGDVDINIRYK